MCHTHAADPFEWSHEVLRSGGIKNVEMQGNKRRGASSLLCPHSEHQNFGVSCEVWLPFLAVAKGQAVCC